MSLTRQPYRGIKRQRIELRLPINLLAVIDQRSALEGVSRTEKIKDLLETSLGGSSLPVQEEMADKSILEQLLKYTIETNYMAASVYGNNKGRMTSNLGSEATAVARKKIMEFKGDVEAKNG
ncbi:MAG: hypothetical protein WCK49_07185 [Myxococcaceae bacterium]